MMFNVFIKDICSFLTVIVIFTIMLMTTAFRIQVIHMKPFEICWQMTLMSLWTGSNNILWRQIPKNNPICFYSHRIIAKVSWGFFLYPTLNDYHLILSHIILSYRTLPYLQLCLSYLTLSYLHSYWDMCGSYKVCNFYNFVFFFQFVMLLVGTNSMAHDSCFGRMAPGERATEEMVGLLDLWYRHHPR